MGASSQLWMDEVERIIEDYAFDDPEYCTQLLMAKGLTLDEAQAEIEAATE